MVFRLGLVGRGRWGRNIERTLLSFPDVSVVSVERNSKPHSGLDGVVVVTQSATHADVALDYIEAGIATFIEKPMATSNFDAARIRDAAERSGALVFVGHLYLHHPAFIAALELLPALGAVRFVLCEGMNNNPRTDSSVLWDWLPHDLSMAMKIFDCDPLSVAAWSLSGGSMPVVALTRYQFGQVPVISTVSWMSPVRSRKMTVSGEEATLVFDDTAERRLTLYRGRDEIVFPACSDELPLSREMNAFLQAIRTGKKDASHLEMGVSIVRAIAAAEQSIGIGGQPMAIR